MGLPNYSTMCRVSERRMVKTLAQLKQEQHDSSELVDLHNEELSLFIIDDRERRDYKYAVCDEEGSGAILHLAPELAKTVKWETMIPGTIIRCLALKVIGGELTADANAHIQKVLLSSLTEAESKFFVTCVPALPRRIMIEDLLVMDNQLVTEELVVKVKHKITESAAWGPNKLARIKMVDASGRITFQVYQPEDRGTVSLFETEQWYKVRGALLDVSSGAEAVLKNCRGVTKIEKLEEDQVKEQPSIPSHLEKGDCAFVGKVYAIDKVNFLDMCQFCPKPSMYCKAHLHSNVEDKKQYSLTLVCYSIPKGEKIEIRATEQKLTPYKADSSMPTYDEETVQKAYAHLLKTPCHIFYNKTFDARNKEHRDNLFEGLELVDIGPGPGKRVSGEAEAEDEVVELKKSKA